MTEADILYQRGAFWVARATFGTGRFKPQSAGYRVWQDGTTHATCVARIGYAGADGLRRAVAECDRRATGVK